MTIRDRVEDLVAAVAPLGWFGDPHGFDDYPRCCELRDAILALIEGMVSDA